MYPLTSVDACKALTLGEVTGQGAVAKNRSPTFKGHPPKKKNPRKLQTKAREIAGK